MDTQNPNTIIDRLGGTSATARLCEIQPPSVSEWRKTGIPKTQLKFLKAIRPDVFGESPAKRKKPRTPAPPP
ncbi:Rha family transcriptional regulator [Massilia violaceinigra]|uniref:Rha family transcriptional regulator n=1 Tax=Massilia violaceinigra TaxID=2045208 RepID=A0A2D2DSD1_9BURK|nr:Rha family transcriptional regulator [Massilia violaceinigra]ATQ77874.1 Rha family transcriptional regulator [Massilia violaceinigra]